MLKLFPTGNPTLKINIFRSLRTSIQSHTQYRLFSFKKFPQQNFNAYTSVARIKGASKQKPNMALTFLGVLGVSSLYLTAHKPILNDSGYANPPIVIGTDTPANIYYDNSKPVYDGAFGGKLNYHQVALGSMSGLIIGYALSRLSSVLFVLGLGCYLLGVFLRKQGIVVVDTKSVVKDAVSSVAWEELVFDQTSFSIPFVLSFLTSATL